MNSAPGSELLPPGDRQLFIEQFEKDVHFFQLFFLLISRCCPIRNIDLVWVEHGPSGRAGLRHLGITEALASPHSSLLGVRERNPHPGFCNLINGYGKHEAQTCGRSDKAAEELVRKTGKTQVYRCLFGLVDVAVPVMLGSQHIATLFTGQVLREPPSREGFERILRDVAGLAHIDRRQLEQAYWQVPVVTDEDIRNITEILQGFAQYIANGWVRMAEAVKERRRKDRELHIARKEFAYLALEAAEAGTANPEEARRLMRDIGLSQPPSRVLVVRLEAEEQGPAVSSARLDLGLSSALQAIEEIAEKLDNVVAVLLPKTGICVFFHDPPADRRRTSGFYAHRLAAKIVHTVRGRCDMRVRVGVGSAVKEWRNLGQSYREACIALAGSQAAVASYVKPAGSFRELSRSSARVCLLIREKRIGEARDAIEALPVQVSRHLGAGLEDLGTAATFYLLALESLEFTVREMGCDERAVAAWCGAAHEDFRKASNALQLQEVWVRAAGGLVEEVRRLYSGKRKKIVEQACQAVDRLLERGARPREVSIGSIAAGLDLSSSHLSRLFKRATGDTFEHYVIAGRVARAKRLLLDPLLNISQVAEQCGFSDPSYFARVFRRVAGCSPTQYCQDPLRAVDQPAAPRPEKPWLPAASRGRALD